MSPGYAVESNKQLSLPARLTAWWIDWIRVLLQGDLLPEAMPRMAHGWRMIATGSLALAGVVRLDAQIDPVPRELIQLGYNQALQGHAPISGYAFYYRNSPTFLCSNLTLRLAVAPVYLDSELGISGALGPNTDLGIGLAGGGFADSYSEIREGEFIQRESFLGHGGEVSTSVYHRFNPGARIPLYLVLRGSTHYSVYGEDNKTDDNFELPPNQTTFRLRTGLRWGGQEPVMLAQLAMELSCWYEAELRLHPDAYGYADDREIHNDVHLFWGRAMLAYTLPEWKHNFSVSLTSGTSIHTDRFSAYRLGGLLPLSAEFPLSLPGYYFQEISAKEFGLLAGIYSVPIDVDQRWSVAATAAVAGVDYVDGLEQSGKWHSGVGGGVLYRSASGSWQVLVSYAYGIQALRDGDRGAHSVGFLFQFDLGRTRQSLFDPGDNPNRSRGLQRFIQILR